MTLDERSRELFRLVEIGLRGIECLEFKHDRDTDAAVAKFRVRLIGSNDITYTLAARITMLSELRNQLTQLRRCADRAGELLGNKDFGSGLFEILQVTAEILSNLGCSDAKSEKPI